MGGFSRTVRGSKSESPNSCKMHANEFYFLRFSDASDPKLCGSFTLTTKTSIFRADGDFNLCP